MKEISKVLFIRLGGIGDVVFTLPAINLARQNLPSAHFTYLTSQACSPLLKGFPGLNKILTIDKDLYHSNNLKKIWQYSRELFKSLRKEKYQLVVDFQGFGETALLSLISGAKMRWGITHNKWRDRIYTISLEENQTPKPHLVDLNRQLLIKGDLVDYHPVNNFSLPVEYLQKARCFFSDNGYSETKPTIYIQPFTNYSIKNWPLENHLAVAKYWRNNGIQIIFGGGPSDKAALKQITEEFPVSAGKVDLLTNAGLIQLSTLIIGSDTGLLHLATAMEKRVLMLMASTSPESYGPYGHPEWAYTPKNGSYKIEDIHPTDINQKIAEIIC